MDIQITEPEQVKTKEVRSVNIILAQNLAIVEVWGKHRERIEMDLTTILADASSTQLNTIKLFLKSIIANSLGLKVNDIPNTVFKNN